MNSINGAARFDLHAHTTASDGTLSPSELMQVAKHAGLEAIAVTDHDTVEGLAEAETAARELGIQLVPGVEVSANFGNVAVHVLGLFIDYRESWLRERFAEAFELRRVRVHKIVAKLSKVGVELTAEEVFARSSHGSVGRPHVAEALVAKGVVGSLQEAFDRYLAQDRPAYVGYERVTLRDATELIRRAGGVASLAHPVLLRDDALIADMVDDELQAIEVFHTDHTREKAAEYQILASELGLLATGGSDFHRPDDGGHAEVGCAELTREAFEAIRAAASAG